jgi:ABC-type lipoprotein export system ATPase subunit
MNIDFQKIIPNPLKEFITPYSIWNTDFSFKSGEMYQIIAPSGKGKSTLVGLLAGTRGDFLGRLILEGQSSTEFSPMKWSQWRALKCSVVFQDLQLFQNLTALQNITLTAEIHQIHHKKQVPSQHIQSLETLTEWATLLGVETKLNQPVALLSFGQMQRIAILRALNRPFNWIVLDEPFSHLDQTNANIALNLIQKVAAQQSAGIIITALDDRYALPGFQNVTI